MADQVFGSGEFRTTKNPRVGVLQLSESPARQYRFSEIDDLGLFEGDIIVGRGLELQGIAVVHPGARWPQRTVSYAIDPGLPDPQRVHDAIAHWQRETAIRFQERSNERDYVLFRRGGGCASAVGRIGGVQWITLGRMCTTGNAIHEIGHAVGLWHEQSREDRDQHVKIAWDNIDPYYQHNFDQHITDGDDVGGYDFGSIMHYPRGAFAIDSTRPTIIAPADEEIGQREGLSVGDIATVAQMYP